MRECGYPGLYGSQPSEENQDKCVKAPKSFSIALIAIKLQLMMLRSIDFYLHVFIFIKLTRVITKIDK